MDSPGRLAAVARGDFSFVDVTPRTSRDGWKKIDGRWVCLQCIAGRLGHDGSR
jgi:hypothetical protein